MPTSSPLDVAAAFRFLRALRKQNDRAWFEANRAAYDESIKPHFAEFVTGLLIAATSFDARYAAIDPRRCIFRIYRDVRFSADKTPYKTRLSAFLSPRGWRGTTPGFYVGLEPGASIFAAGVYTPEKAVLADLRRRFAAGDSRFERLLRRRTLAPYLPLDTDPLARVPRGFDPDHPHAQWLRARRLMARRTFTDAELTRGDAFALLRRAMRDTAPLVSWIDESLDGGLEPRDAGAE